MYSTSYVDAHGTGDLFAALDFSGGVSAESDDSSAAYDMPVAGAADTEEPVYSFEEYLGAEPVQDTDTGIAALAHDCGQPRHTDDSSTELMVTVTNPPESVTVVACASGRLHQIEVWPKATGMSGSELAEEILIIADLAHHQARARQRELLVRDAPVPDLLDNIGVDGTQAVHEFVQSMGLPTPQQAAAATASVFATRYAGGADW
ncbi:hypothetical protein [Mycobacterium ahvazicum]|uniref:hypothetical protein n=1 Tax=Mycobacterium ahvazicum TaxID=1964395 RepID=UPI000BB8472E|nr:hypothetical protein [Mycobacterium ahvazicum]